MSPAHTLNNARLSRTKKAYSMTLKGTSPHMNAQPSSPGLTSDSKKLLLHIVHEIQKSEEL